MKQFKAWLRAIVQRDAPAADVESFDDPSLEWRRRQAHAQSMERLTVIRARFPLEMGSRRFV